MKPDWEKTDIRTPLCSLHSDSVSLSTRILGNCSYVPPGTSFWGSLMSRAFPAQYGFLIALVIGKIYFDLWIHSILTNKGKRLTCILLSHSVRVPLLLIWYAVVDCFTMPLHMYNYVYIYKHKSMSLCLYIHIHKHSLLSQIKPCRMYHLESLGCCIFYELHIHVS